jgi:hypothetical protein
MTVRDGDEIMLTSVIALSAFRLAAIFPAVSA